jgi:hypothetical protein
MKGFKEEGRIKAVRRKGVEERQEEGRWQKKSR